MRVRAERRLRCLAERDRDGRRGVVVRAAPRNPNDFRGLDSAVTVIAI